MCLVAWLPIARMSFMHTKSFGIAGPKLFQPRRFADARGYFCETFRADVFAAHCGPFDFVQDNESLSETVGTIRGLHFQTPPHVQGKLVRCTAGAIFDVAVDIRVASSTYGQWVGEILTPANGMQMWVPPGFAHGFCSLEPNSVIAYKVTGYYNAACDQGLAWDDPAIGILWPDVADRTTLSAKDRMHPVLADLPAYFGTERVA